MKIKRIEFENFRNFKNRGYIECSTDKKITIIYGKNGDGKTTLHQLFQWVFYGRVHFNQTTTDKLYNTAVTKHDANVLLERSDGNGTEFKYITEDGIKKILGI